MKAQWSVEDHVELWLWWLLLLLLRCINIVHDNVLPFGWLDGPVGQRVLLSHGVELQLAIQDCMLH